MRPLREWFKRTVIDPIERNEWLLENDPQPSMFGCSLVVATQLIEHPTIRCLWIRYHDEAAVWRNDMRYPECRACHVEDPYT